MKLLNVRGSSDYLPRKQLVRNKIISILTNNKDPNVENIYNIALGATVRDDNEEI